MWVACSASAAKHCLRAECSMLPAPRFVGGFEGGVADRPVTSGAGRAPALLGMQAQASIRAILPFSAKHLQVAFYASR
jgi:hypothetical protein